MAKAVKRTQDEVSFSCAPAERAIIRKIAQRARALWLDHGIDRSLLDIDMDITATHCNGNPLRLADLRAADDFNFMHDVGGIARHLDRETGFLMDHFSPRFSRRA